MLPARMLAPGTLSLLAVWCVVVMIGGRRHSYPVYTVAALRAHLSQDPGAWVDRPLRVRAIADACSGWFVLTTSATACIAPQPVLADPAPGAEPLPLAWGSASPLVAFLRGLPLLRSVAPAPQRPRWDAPAVYRIELRARPCGPADQQWCYEALLLDAESSPLLGARER